MPPSRSRQTQFLQLFTHHSTAGGFIIRDWSSQLLKAGAAHYGKSRILVTNARALRDGVIAVAHLGIKHLQIEGDNATVIWTFRGEVSLPWQIATII